jgi:hypothetical protein
MKGHKAGLFWAFGGLLCFFISGCATLMSGEYQRVTIQSNPSEASIRILNSDGMDIYNSRTPAATVLKKGNGFLQGAKYMVILEKEGYKKQRIVLRSTANGWYLLGNFFFGVGGLIGWLVVDPATGAMWSLSPDKVSAQMIEEVSVLK